jgi:hypothetical protein
MSTTDVKKVRAKFSTWMPPSGAFSSLRELAVSIHRAWSRMQLSRGKVMALLSKAERRLLKRSLPS